jgi:HlyD family secretion protein
MDRPIEPAVLRNRFLRHLGSAVVFLAIAWIAGSLLVGWIRPSIDRSHLRTATVVRGTIYATVTASGIVTPANETAVSSPVEARIVRIVRRPGAVLQPGDAILELDLSQSALDVERIEQQLARKMNELQQAALARQTGLTQLSSRLAQKQLDRELFGARADRDRRLLSEGLVSPEVVRESETAARKARIEVEQLVEEVAQARRTASAEVAGIELDRKILERELAMARRQMELAAARSDRHGVLTWVTPDEGVTVRRGDTLARVADLESFRIEATASDIHAARLSPEGLARIRIGDERLDGTIAAIDPTISGGLVRFTVTLDDPSHRALRNNQRVDVEVITGRRDDVLKVRRGSFVDQGRTAAVYVVEGDRALRRRTSLGLIGDGEVEIVSGIAEGEEVVVSDLADYREVAEIRIR